MSFLENVIRSSARIEERLEQLGGQGAGMYELSTTIRPPLNANLRNRLQAVARVRNQLAHEPDYRFDGDEGEFLAMCESVLDELGAPLPSQTLPLQSLQTMPANSADNANKWVEFKAASWKDSYASSSQKRIVHFLGATPVRVLDDGVHGVPLPLFKTRDFDRIAIVTMGPRRVEYILRGAPGEAGNIATKDGINLQVACSLQLSVLDTHTAVQMVALHPDDQVKLILDRVTASFKTVARRHSYAALNAAHDEMISQVIAEFAPEQAVGCAFQLEAIYLNTLEPQDATIREVHLRAAQVDERAKLTAKEAKHQADKLQLEAKEELKKTKQQIAIDSIKEDHELKIARKRELQEVRLQNKRLDYTIRSLEKTAKVLQTDEGKLAFNFTDMLKYWTQLKEIERDIAVAKDRKEMDLLRMKHNKVIGEMQGELNVASQVMKVGLGEKIQLINHTETRDGAIEMDSSQEQGENDKSDALKQ